MEPITRDLATWFKCKYESGVAWFRCKYESQVARQSVSEILAVPTQPHLRTGRWARNLCKKLKTFDYCKDLNIESGGLNIKSEIRDTVAACLLFVDKMVIIIWQHGDHHMTTWSPSYDDEIWKMSNQRGARSSSGTPTDHWPEATAKCNSGSKKFKLKI